MHTECIRQKEGFCGFTLSTYHALHQLQGTEKRKEIKSLMRNRKHKHPIFVVAAKQ